MSPVEESLIFGLIVQIYSRRRGAVMCQPRGKGLLEEYLRDFIKGGEGMNCKSVFPILFQEGISGVQKCSGTMGTGLEVSVYK